MLQIVDRHHRWWPCTALLIAVLTKTVAPARFPVFHDIAYRTLIEGVLPNLDQQLAIAGIGPVSGQSHE